MVQRYELEEDWSTGRKNMAENDEGSFVDYEDYEKLRRKAEELVLESAKIYAAYNKLVPYDDFMDMQTIQELADLL